MEEVWRQGEATVRSVLEAMNAAAGQPERAYTTVLTILQRLDRKGLVSRSRRGKTRDHRQPFERRVSGRRMRARISLKTGEVLTIDRRLRRCR